MNAQEKAVDALFIPLLPHFHNKEKETRAWIRGILQTYRQELMREVREKVREQLDFDFRATESYHGDRITTKELARMVAATLDTAIAKAEKGER